MKRQLEQLRNWGAVLLLGLTSPLLADAASSTGVSPIFTVDTRVSPIAVSGRVLNAVSRSPISGATVTLAGQNTSSSGAGLFSFAGVSMSSGNTLAVSQGGYATYTGTVPAPAGATAVTVPDILLQLAPVGSKPVVTKVEPELKGLFLSSVTLNNEFTASVNWNGVMPGHVRFSVNGTQVSDETGSGLEYVASLNMGNSPFSPSFAASGNRVTVQAIGNGGEMSNPFNVDVGILPMPDPIKRVTGQGWPFTTFLDGHVGLDYDFPNPPIAAVLNLPVIGRFGFEVAANASFDYTVTDGEWEAAFGVGAEGKQGKRGRRPTIPGLTRYPKMKLYIGNKEIFGKLEAGLRGTATLQSGITFDEVFGHGEIGARLELGRVGLLDLLGPGLSSAIGGVPGLGDLAKTVSAIIYVIPDVEGDVTFALNPTIAFETLEMTGKIGLDVTYEPKLSERVRMRLYVGGEPSVTFGIPGDLFKNVRFRAYAGAEFQVWVFHLPPVKFVFVDVSYPSVMSFPLAMRAADGTTGVAMFRVVSAGGDTVRPVSREYLLAGPEGFVANSQTVLSRAADGTALSALDAFRQIGRKPVKGSVAARSPWPTRDGGFDPLAEGTNQVNLTLATNVFPDSEPAMASRNQELMLLYVTDNGSSNNLQFTDIRWTRWDGSNWSTALTIHTNTQAEFAPQVAYDGNGDALAVWERVADPNFNQTNLTAMAAQMEIVWARWSRTNGQWSTPQALTANGYLDFAPLLCGPMTDGSVLVVWTKNAANLLMGTNSAGSQVLSAQWNPASQNWSVPQTLLADLPYRLSQSLAGKSNRAVYAWSRDLDGVLTNASDQQVFYCQWTNGVWAVAKQFTTNSLGNRNARVAVSLSGSVYLVWQQGTNLVLSANYSTNASLVRADSQTAGFADYAMTFGPSGNLVLLWQEMSQDGSDAYYAVYDPVSVTWSKDARLFQDAPLERSFAPVWDNVGNLTFAYNKVEIITTNKTVTLEGGGTITITNVPQSGRVDLCVTKRALVRDLALKAGDFGASGNNFLPGDPVTLLATVRNTGNVAMSNIVVAFWDGNPTNSGTIITNVTLPGWLEGAATNTATALWIVAEPATNHVLYAVVNPSGLASEFDELNNRQSLSVGGTDLASSLVTYSVETNGAMRVIAQVHNLGAPSATNSVLSIRRANASGTNASGPVLATVAVPMLEPGRLAQVALDLPPVTQPEGEAFYQLKADETGVVSDVDTNNNRTTFAVNLWLDADGDGMPDSWESQYPFLSSTNAADALLDYDGDGLSNLAEYLAGTAPNDPASYLRMTGIGRNGTNGVAVAWGSATNKLYTLQRSSNLGTAFTNLAQHILSTPPENVYLDTTATNAANFFYRVKVE